MADITKVKVNGVEYYVRDANACTNDDDRLSDARPADGGTSDYANALAALGGITYGDNKLQYYDTAADAGNNPTWICNPTSAWWHHIIMNHGNSDGYYFDMAFSFFDDDIRYRRITGGEDNGWIRVIDENNISAYLPSDATTSAAGLMSAADKIKLDEIKKDIEEIKNAINEIKNDIAERHSNLVCC